MNSQLSTINSQPVALGYVRVSTDRQDLSVDAQTEMVKRAALYHQAGELSLFEEPDTSGRIDFIKRPQGAELLAQARELIAAGHPVTLIVPKVDRLGRDTVDISNTVRLFESLGVRILFLDINVDTRTPMGRAFMQIAAVFAELEVARIRERIQTVLDHKRGAGELVGSLSYGWNARYVFADGHEELRTTSPLTRTERDKMVLEHGQCGTHIEDNLDEQKWILQMAYWRRVCGWSYNRIAKELNFNAVPTKRTGETLKLRQGDRGATDKTVSGSWQFGQVETILTNATVTKWLETQTLKQAA